MIYAVEDDRNIRELIVYALRQSGFEAEGFEDGSRLMELPAPELVILDIMLPGEDGLSILRRLRADPVRKRVPVILLTALSGEENRVDGFEAGADGYITKPFGVMELIARVKAVLRRGGYGLRVGGIELDEKRHAVYANGQNVQITLKEYELLSFLMAHAGTAFDREQLLSEVWGMDYFGGTRCAAWATAWRGTGREAGNFLAHDGGGACGGAAFGRDFAMGILRYDNR